MSPEDNVDKWIQYEGRDENGDKSYFVHYEGHDVGTYDTYDEAVLALREYLSTFL